MEGVGIGSISLGSRKSILDLLLEGVNVLGLEGKSILILPSSFWISNLLHGVKIEN